jgi:sugar phosphate isomerase/epimerase
VRQRFGHRLRHVHLSDNAGKGWDSHLPPGEGVLDIDGFLRDLADSGFDGTVSLEVDLRKRLDDPAGVRSLLVEMREQVESLLAVA